jgi:hypothetical protein
MIAAARAMPVVTIGENSAAVFQKAAFQRNSTAMIFRSKQKSPALGGAKVGATKQRTRQSDSQPKIKSRLPPCAAAISRRYY